MSKNFLGLLLIALSLTANALPAAPDNNTTGIHEAAQAGDLVYLQKHLTQKNINSWDSSCRTPLHCAVSRNNNLACVELLVTEGAWLNAIDKEHNLPLHGVAFHGNLTYVLSLLSHAVCLKYNTTTMINAQNNQGLTPLHFAVMGSCYDTIIQTSQTKKPTNTEIEKYRPTCNQHLACIKVLVTHGATLNTKIYADNVTALDLAQKFCNKDIVAILEQTMRKEKEEGNKKS